MFKGLLFFVRFGLKTRPRYIVYLVLYQFINALIPLTAISMPKFIIDELMGAQRIGYIALYVGILVGYTLVAGCLSTYLRLTCFTYRVEVSQAFIREMSEKLYRADYQSLQSPAFHDVKGRAEKFLYGDWHGFSYVLDCALIILGQAFTLAGIIAIVASLNPLMVLLFIALVALSALVEGRSKKRAIALDLEQAAVERRGMYFSRLFDDAAYAKELRLNGLGPWLLSRLGDYGQVSLGYYRQKNAAYIKSGVFGALMGFIQQCCAYAYLTAQVLFSGMSIGDFTLYVGAVTSFSGAMRTVMDGVIDIRAYGKYYDAMEEFLQIGEALRQTGHEPLPHSPYELSFHEVSFRYQGQERDAIHKLSLTLQPGEKLAVVGENGAGKTTLVKLMCRLYDPSEGEVRLNGIDIRQIDYDAYMALFSTVFQDFKLFAFSLKENVVFGGRAEDGQVEALLACAGLGARLEGLPRGVHTPLYREFDESGFEPSGGEGQKIALARALYKDAPIIVLDEPAAALDPRAEHELYARFDRLVQDKSAVYISHRLSSTRFCDRILVLEDGRLIEEGTHAELMARRGAYHQLFSMQAEYYV